MFESLFPIFCFGVVITGIVAKGMMTAAEVAHSGADLEDQRRSRSAFSRSAPTANDGIPANDWPPAQTYR